MNTRMCRIAVTVLFRARPCSYWDCWWDTPMARCPSWRQGRAITAEGTYCICLFFHFILLILPTKSMTRSCFYCRPVLSLGHQRA